MVALPSFHAFMHHIYIASLECLAHVDLACRCLFLPLAQASYHWSHTACLHGMSDRAQDDLHTCMGMLVLMLAA